MSPTAPLRNLVAVRPEMAGITADPATTTLIIGTMTGGAGTGSGLVSRTMEVGAAGIEPVLASGMIGADMAIVTGCRSVAVDAAGGMATVTNVQIGGPGDMSALAVSPARPIRPFAAAWSEMTGVTRDAAASSSIIVAVAGGATRHISSCNSAMIAAVVLVEPG